ncbi:MAG: Holliday junction resolvase RuvX [candidate division Zixibacteria bacterium]|nr:Holliday junction resolvase RuvX [candidate division Zixibacteria bacterium]
MTESYERTFIGIDYGERRIGLAKSDPTGLIASALKTLQVGSPKDALRQIAEVIREYEPNGLVVGYPVNIDGEKTRKCQEIDRFIKKLKTVYPGPIYREDERHSSEDAADIIHEHRKRAGSDKGRIDRLAATVFLQHFLDELPRE